MRDQTPMMGRELRLCQTHREQVQDARCLSCRFALDWNLYRRFCACGAPATGYRTLAADAPVEFLCDDHFVGIEADR